MKKITGLIKLQLPAGKANPAPPVGPALGAHGVNIMGFCKEFNAKSLAAGFEKDTPVPVVITVFSDKSFAFIMKTPPASFLLKKAAKITSGSQTPGRGVAGTVTMAQCRDIAKVKLNDLNTSDLEQGARIIAGSARSMGLTVEA